MSYRRLDDKGKPLPAKGRTSRKAAVKRIHGVPHHHYEIYVSILQENGRNKYVRRRYWLPGDAEAEDKERELKREEPSGALTWRRAFELWAENNDFTDEHLDNVRKTLDMWGKDFGAGSSIEGTTLAAFSAWVGALAKEGTGRAAQNRRAHLLAIARWARERGYVRELPFEHSPKPADRMKKRPPARPDMFFRILEALPACMRPLWRLLGYTGMRVSAACGIRDNAEDVGEDVLTVTTKFSAVVEYAITPEIREVVEEARRYKAAGWLKGRGKDKVVMPITTDRLFCNARGRAWTKDSFNHKLQKVLRAAGLPAVTPHQLRHMFGTVLGESGFSVPQLQAALAHESPESSEVYVDKTATMRKDGLEAVAKALGVVQKLSKTDTKSGGTAGKESDGEGSDSGRQERFPCPILASIFNKLKK